MILKELNIERNTHDFNYRGLAPGEVGGSIQFTNGTGSDIKIRLNADQAQKIVEVVAEALVDTAKELSQILVAQIIEAAPAAIGHEA